MMSLTVKTLAIACMAGTASASGAGDVYAGYEMATDCTQHANIAYDAQALKACLSETDWENCAMKYYTNGFYSKKSSGNRTLQGFSTAAASKFTGYYDGGVDIDVNFTVANKFYNYYGEWEYADTWMYAATDMTGVWASTSAWDGVMGDAENARKQATKKGAGFIVNQMYAMYEYFKRANQAYRCMAGTKECTDTDDSSDAVYAMVHGWDEGWAFFAGALESGSGDSGIDWPLTLAEKRASSFGTDTATYLPNGGDSWVNSKMLAASQIGRDALNPFDESSNGGQIVWDAWKCIEQQAFLPMIQGCLLYMYKSDACTADCGDEYGEMYTFCSSMVPLLHHVSSTDAATLMSYVAPDQITSTGLAADYDTMKVLIYDNLNNMGYKIAEVGACTYCGDTLDDFDLSGDAYVSNLCGMAYPKDETVVVTPTAAPAATDDSTTTPSPTVHEEDDHDHDCDDDDDEGGMNTISVIILIVGIICILGGVAMMLMNKGKAGVAPA